MARWSSLVPSEQDRRNIGEIIGEVYGTIDRIPVSQRTDLCYVAASAYFDSEGTQRLARVRSVIENLRDQ